MRIFSLMAGLIGLLTATAGRAAPPSWAGEPAGGARDLEEMWTVVNDPPRAV